MKIIGILVLTNSPRPRRRLRAALNNTVCMARKENWKLEKSHGSPTFRWAYCTTHCDFECFFGAEARESIIQEIEFFLILHRCIIFLIKKFEFVYCKRMLGTVIIAWDSEDFVVGCCVLARKRPKNGAWEMLEELKTEKKERKPWNNHPYDDEEQ